MNKQKLFTYVIFILILLGNLYPGICQDQQPAGNNLTGFSLNGNDVSKVLVSIRSIEIHSESEGWILIIVYGDTGKTYDLLTLRSDKSALLGAFYLKPGNYTQIRLKLNPKNQIEVDEGQGPELKPLKIASGLESGIKLIHPFTVASQEDMTAIVVDLDAKKSLKYTKGGGYSLKPVIKIKEVYESTEITKFISASQGGSIDIFNEIEFEVPAGALSEDTVITITPKEPLTDAALSPTRTALGKVYEMQPHGLVFNKPAAMTMYYDLDEIKEKNLSEQMQKISTFSESGDESDKNIDVFESTVDTSTKTVTGQVTHFSNFTNSSTLAFAFKYWNMRVRLRHKFLKVGTGGTSGPAGQGYSLPADRRVSFTADHIHDNEGVDDAFIMWGDSASYLGWYIGVLATEYYMLNHPGDYPYFGGANDKRNVLIELYCALNALERLDKNGEEYMWHGQWPRWESTLIGAEGFLWPDTPGFFVRDDVPFGFQENLHTKLISDIPMASDYISTEFRNKQMSQDQVIHILLGLALVKKCVPESAHYKGVNLLGFAKRKAEEITSWVAGNGWIVKDPVQPRVHHFYHMPYFAPLIPANKPMPVKKDRGPDARAFSQGINLTNFYINNKHWENKYMWLWPYVEKLSETYAQIPLKEYLPEKWTTGSLVDNLHMAMTAASVSNGWGATTFFSLMNLAQAEDFYIYPLLNAVIHNPQYGLAFRPLFDQTTSMLDTAPFIGPHRNYHLSVNGWASENRFTKDRLKRNGEGEDHKLGVWEYNGLDYMLLHNLYYIAYKSQFSPILPSDREPLDDVELVVYDRPNHIYNIPPLGYPSFGKPRYEKKICHYTISVDIFMTIGDMDGDHKKIIVNFDQPNPPVGMIKQDIHDKNKFIFEGLAARDTHYETAFHVYLTDERGATNTINVPLIYDGLAQKAPKVGAVAHYSDYLVTHCGEICLGYCYKIPIVGIIYFEAVIYVVDYEGDDTWWAIVGLDNCWAEKKKDTDDRIKVSVGWSILSPNGSASVTIRAWDECGATTDYTIPINW